MIKIIIFTLFCISNQTISEACKNENGLTLLDFHKFKNDGTFDRLLSNVETKTNKQSQIEKKSNREFIDYENEILCLYETTCRDFIKKILSNNEFNISQINLPTLEEFIIFDFFDDYFELNIFSLFYDSEEFYDSEKSNEYFDSEESNESYELEELEESNESNKSNDSEKFVEAFKFIFKRELFLAANTFNKNVDSLKEKYYKEILINKKALYNMLKNDNDNETREDKKSNHENLKKLEYENSKEYDIEETNKSSYYKELFGFINTLNSEINNIFFRMEKEFVNFFNILQMSFLSKIKNKFFKNKETDFKKFQNFFLSNIVASNFVKRLDTKIIEKIRRNLLEIFIN